jgi:AraC-like DNA-binding protein
MQKLRTPHSWLQVLARPGTRLEVDLLGLPALYHARIGWQNYSRPFGQHLIYFVVSGSISVRAGEHDTFLQPGDLVWFPPWSTFACRLPEKQAAVFYRFRLGVHDARGRELCHSAAPRIVRDRESVRPWIEEIVRHPGRPAGPLRAWRLRGALLGFFADVLAPPPRATARGKLDLRQREALTGMLHGTGAGRLTPARLAARLRLTPDYFARLFRRTYNVSPRLWIVRERIKQAAVCLLESQLSISEVAEEFGYRDIFFFSRQFKQVLGRSPRSYRRQA